MASTLGVEHRHPAAFKRAPLLLFLLGITLNQTSVIFDINLSIADVFAFLILMMMILTARMAIPLGPIVYFLVLSILVITMGGFVVPHLLPIEHSLLGVLTDYTKLVTSFGYFLLGVNIVRAGQARIVMRSYIFMAVLIGIIGVVGTTLPSLPRLEFMFHWEIRFSGLMNDPNYFALIQLIAMAFLWHDPDIARRFRYPALMILAASVLASGSKTGLLTLLILLMWRGFHTVFSSPHQGRYVSPYRALLIGVAICLPVLVLIVMLDYSMRMSVAASLDEVPALSRLTPLLLDFETGIEADGSGRDSAWSDALPIIGLFPLAGVGVGTYLGIAAEFSDEPILAHNTYLQIAAEWGLVMTAIFLVWVGILLLRRPAPGTNMSMWHSTRDALLVMLIGSAGISLQNSRVLWLIVGMLLAVHLFSRARQPLQQHPLTQKVKQ